MAAFIPSAEIDQSNQRFLFVMLDPFVALGTIAPNEAVIACRDYQAHKTPPFGSNP
jgi:hypothetical protein